MTKFDLMKLKIKDAQIKFDTNCNKENRVITLKVKRKRRRECKQANLSFVFHVFGLVESFSNNLEKEFTQNRHKKRKGIKRRRMWNENELTWPAVLAATTADARNSASWSTVEFQWMEFATNRIDE